MKIALYARVSTTEQNTDAQLHALRQYAGARSLEVAEVYVDHGVSGAKARRPALDRLVSDARRRRFDALAVVKLDRLARSVRHLTELAAELDALGIGLVVLDQAIDTTTPAGRLLFHTLAAVAEFERDLIRERTLQGLQAARGDCADADDASSRTLRGSSDSRGSGGRPRKRKTWEPARCRQSCARSQIRRVSRKSRGRR